MSSRFHCNSAEYPSHPAAASLVHACVQCLICFCLMFSRAWAKVSYAGAAPQRQLDAQALHAVCLDGLVAGHQTLSVHHTYLIALSICIVLPLIPNVAASC
jgi:hypothetical protein